MILQVLLYLGTRPRPKERKFGNRVTEMVQGFILLLECDIHNFRLLGCRSQVLCLVSKLWFKIINVTTLLQVVDELLNKSFVIQV